MERAAEVDKEINELKKQIKTVEEKAEKTLRYSLNNIKNIEKLTSILQEQFCDTFLKIISEDCEIRNDNKRKKIVDDIIQEIRKKLSDKPQPQVRYYTLEEYEKMSLLERELVIESGEKFIKKVIENIKKKPVPKSEGEFTNKVWINKESGGNSVPKRETVSLEKPRMAVKESTYSLQNSKPKFMEGNCVRKMNCLDVTEICHLDCFRYHKFNLGEFIDFAHKNAQQTQLIKDIIKQKKEEFRIIQKIWLEKNDFDKDEKFDTIAGYLSDQITEWESEL